MNHVPHSIQNSNNNNSLIHFAVEFIRQPSERLQRNVECERETCYITIKKINLGNSIMSLQSSEEITTTTTTTTRD